MPLAIIVAQPGEIQRKLIDDLAMLGMATQVFPPGKPIPLSLLALASHVIQSVCSRRYENPFSLHELLQSAHFKGQLILVGDTDPRLLAGLALNARAHDLNVVGSLVPPYALHQLRVLCRSDNQNTGKRRSLSLRPPPRSALIKAIQEGAIHPWYQPIISAATGDACRVEVLARWVDIENRPLYEPSQFIPMADQTGLIDAILELVVMKAIEQLSPLIHDGRLTGFSVNISMNNLARPSLSDTLCYYLAKHGLAPKHITLEITENAIEGAVPEILATISRLRLIGFPVAIDDFGTGISGLTHLSQIPFTELKIDRHFVHDVHHNPVNEAICRGAITIARELNMQIVAEGIETLQEGEQMRALGATDLQGFFYARPLPLVELLALKDEECIGKRRI